MATLKELASTVKLVGQDALEKSLTKLKTYIDTQDGTQADAIDAIEEKIPTQATSTNQLADKDFVNSSIETATATFQGTYNTLEELEAVTGADKNDYGFVIATDAAGNTVYKRYKYTGSAWVWEYDLNNSSFTAAQWATINSGMTAALVTKLEDLPTNETLQAALTTINSTLSTHTTAISGLDTRVQTLENVKVMTAAEAEEIFNDVFNS